MNASPPAALYKRLLWMLAIWGMSVLALGIVAMLIRWVIRLTGRGGQ